METLGDLMRQRQERMNPNRGRIFVATARALAVAGKSGWPDAAIGYARSQGYPRDIEQQVIESIRYPNTKAAVTALGTDDFALPSPAAVDFAGFIRPMTIIGKLVGLRFWPARVRMIGATGGFTAYWAGERQPRPLSKMQLAGETIEPLTVSVITVITKELSRSSSPAAESIMSRELGAAAVAEMDTSFIDPANAGIPDVKPASITYGAPVFHSSGPTLANIDADLALPVQGLIDAGSDLLNGVWILRPRTWLYLKRLRGSGGALAFPDLTTVRAGGFLLGFPVIVSAASLSDVGSPQTGGEITLLDASQILVADDGGGAVQVSDEGSLLMTDNPTSPATMTSLFQTESVGLKLTRYVNWRRTRPGMVQLLDGVAY